MKLPKEYRKYAVPGGYEKCNNSYGRKMLLKFGFGPKPVVEETPKLTPKPLNKKTTRQIKIKAPAKKASKKD